MPSSLPCPIGQISLHEGLPPAVSSGPLAATPDPIPGGVSFHRCLEEQCPSKGGAPTQREEEGDGQRVHGFMTSTTTGPIQGNSSLDRCPKK